MQIGQKDSGVKTAGKRCDCTKSRFDWQQCDKQLGESVKSY
ncbi:hypothetical protein AVDCRST_MAG92-1210 [uncultured Coleofasciculus sp.]|uniref:Uncharacterized protein n=1 Tax=uncultured Coleofasciculus sp. TaxID=1267456 RepID=A0A6J4HWG6_9CYAN|nr:hypothetical protein AVDCRST_MAG92-1210 [uncultured Coleofasciculus sp.]